MRLTTRTLLSIVPISHVLAGRPSNSDVCPDAAESYLYSDLNATEIIDYCTSSVLTGTVALCLAQRFPDQVSQYWKTFGSSYCTPASLPEYAAALANATVYLASAPETQLNVTNTPFLIPDDIFQTWYNTDYAYYDNIYLSQTYGWVIVVLGCAVMFFASMLRLLKHMTASNLTPSTRIGKLFQQYVLLPALANKAHSRRPSVLGVQFSIPSRLESFFLFAFVAINIVFSFCSFKIFSGNYYWPLNIDQFQRYVADRSGILSFAQFPFLFAFAGRNTVFIWATGWSFQSFSTFHKWVARMSVFHAFVHTITYTNILWKEGGAASLASNYKDPYLQWGAVAMTAGFLLISLSIYSIRKVWYEVFVISHIVFAILWLVGAYYHVKLLDEREYLPWIWTAVAFWAFDRSVRVLRLLVINFTCSSKTTDKMSTITVLSGSVLKLKIPIADRWQLVPGQYVFLYFPTFKFWQSHPFTILDIFEEVPRSDPITTADNHIVYKSGVGVSVMPDISTAPDSLITSSMSKVKYMTVLFRAHKGVTKELLTHALAQSNDTFKTRVLLEGPYGSTHNLNDFSTVVLVSAGLGITAIIPFLRTLKAQRRVVVHWIVRSRESMSWIQEELVRAGVKNGNKRVSLTLHVTEGGEKETESGTGVNLKYGKPNVQQLLASEFDVCGENEKIAVLACGPGGFMDDARDGVCQSLGDGSGRAVEYFEESYTW